MVSIIREKMKRISMSLSALICLTMSLSAVLPVSADTIRYLRGDANGDGVVNINDVTYIQRYLVDLETDPQGTIWRNGDVDGNGLDINDATKIQGYLAEFDDPYSVGKTVIFDEYELPLIPNN